MGLGDFVNRVKEVKDRALDQGKTFAESLDQAKTEVENKAREAVDKGKEKARDVIPDRDTVNNFIVAGIQDAKDTVDTVKQTVSYVVPDRVETAANNFFDTGVDRLENLRDNIQTRYQGIEDTAKDLIERGADHIVPAVGAATEELFEILPANTGTALFGELEQTIDRGVTILDRLPVPEGWKDVAENVAKVNFQGFVDNTLDGNGTPTGADWGRLYQDWFFERTPQGLGEWDSVNVGGQEYDRVTVTDLSYAQDLSQTENIQGITQNFLSQNPQLGEQSSVLWLYTGDGTVEGGKPWSQDVDSDNELNTSSGGHYGIVQSYLGSYNTDMEIIHVDPSTGERTVQYTVTNNSHWESGTRIPASVQNLGLPSFLVPDRGRDQGLNIGGNFQQVFTWEQTFDAQGNPLGGVTLPAGLTPTSVPDNGSRILEFKDDTIEFLGDVRDNAGAFIGGLRDTGENIIDTGRHGFDRAGDIIRERVQQSIDGVLEGPGLPEVLVGPTPGDEIDKLNSDGDRVVISLVQEGKTQALGGIKQQYGYSVVVEQVGNHPAAGSSGDPATYNVTFDKKLLGGTYGEIPVIQPLDFFTDFEPQGELNIKTADTVTMNFATMGEAERAVAILGDVAIQNVVDDLQINGLNNPLENPLGDATINAGDIGINQADADFLGQNIVSYSTTLTGQGRAKAKAEAQILGSGVGIEPRLDANGFIVRTVTLPRNGEAGGLAYTFGGELELTSKGSIKGSLPLPDDILKAGPAMQIIFDHGNASAETTVSWDLPDSAFTNSFAGRITPEQSLNDSLALGTPDNISVEVQINGQKPSLSLTGPEWSRTNQGRFTIEANIDTPGQQQIDAINELANGNLSAAQDLANLDAGLNVTYEDVDRYGFKIQPEIGFEALKVIEGKASVIFDIGRDDITNRYDITLGG